MATNNATNTYAPYTIIVDATGSTPYSTIASGITAASSVGAKTVFIRPGTYTENLTLVNGVNLQGDNRYSTIINGQHIIPTAGSIEISDLGLASSGNNSIFNEGSTGSCAVNVIDCEFNITGAGNNYGFIFNIYNSHGPLSITGCTDISTTNAISVCAAGVLTITDSTLGSTSSPTASFYYTTYIINSTIGCSTIQLRAAQPVIWQNSALNGGTYILYNGTTSTFYNCALDVFFQQAGNANLSIYNCKVSSSNVPFTLNDTAQTRIDNSTINAGANIAISLGASSTAQLNNVVISSSATNVITGTGTVTITEATFTSSTGISATVVTGKALVGTYP